MIGRTKDKRKSTAAEDEEGPHGQLLRARDDDGVHQQQQDGDCPNVEARLEAGGGPQDVEALVVDLHHPVDYHYEQEAVLDADEGPAGMRVAEEGRVHEQVPQQNQEVPPVTICLKIIYFFKSLRDTWLVNI